MRITFVGYKNANREGVFLMLGQNLRLDISLSEATTALAGMTVVPSSEQYGSA